MTNFDYVFFGSSIFSQVVLAQLISHGYYPCLVVLPQNKPSGRKQILQTSSLVKFCQTRSLSYLEVANFKDQITIEKIKQSGCALAILASFGKIIPTSVISLFSQGIINIHPSLLPKWRGPSPLQAVLLVGESISGVTLIQLDSEVDHGPIIAQVKINITMDENVTDLEIKLAKIGTELLIKTLPRYVSQKIHLSPQDHGQATFCKMIKREDGHINWQQTACQIYNQWRAFVKWPGVYTFWQGQRLKLLKILLSERLVVMPGKISYQDGKLFIDTKDLALEIQELQLAGGKVLSSQDFIRGHINFISSKLE